MRGTAEPVADTSLLLRASAVFRRVRLMLSHSREHPPEGLCPPAMSTSDASRHGRSWHMECFCRSGVQRSIRVLAAVLIVLTVHACGWSQPPRARLAEEVAGTFSAAAATLEAVHAGEMTRQFAATSFEAFGEQGPPTIADLRSLGLDDRAAAALEEAARVLSEPCLDAGCDWEGQVEVLRRTARDLLASAGG
jgi:hypothetical protein